MRTRSPLATGRHQPVPARRRGRAHGQTGGNCWATRPKPLNPANGTEKPLEMAVIDESVCIGCTLCIQACPVDAIVGAAKLMHSILAHWCTGCELCIAPCPVDCIAMVRVEPERPWTQADADLARSRYYARNNRLAADAREREDKARRQHPAASTAPQDPKAGSRGAQKSHHRGGGRACARAARRGDTEKRRGRFRAGPAADRASRRAPRPAGEKGAS